MSFNADLGIERSYYLATAEPAAAMRKLEGSVEADLAIVGGGATGLSAALHGAQAGLRVVLVEGGRLGWGASGRNGGQLIPGLRQGADTLTLRYGKARARELLALAYEAPPLVASLIETHAIACDYVPRGHLAAAVRPRDLEHMREEAAAHEALDLDHPLELLGPEESRAHVDAPYAGGLFDPAGGHFQPLNYALGLARAARAAGAEVFESSAAVGLQREGPGAVITTAAGEVRARHVMLAGDAYLSGILPGAEARLMPVANYIAATAPLGDAATALLPSNAAISDSRFVVRYFRRTADGRLLFGGGERYSRSPPTDIAAFVRPHLEATFPNLAGVPIEFAWGGLVSITRTRLPHLGRESPILVAHGYSGMGAALSTLAGKLAVDAVCGQSAQFDLLAAVAPPPFPGGPALRGPLHVAGMLWYALRDRL